MTDTVLPATPTATPLAVRLASAEPQLETVAYHGVLTPTQLDVPARETEALLRGAAVHDLGWLRRVLVRGEDRFRWLSGMITNMVNDLPANGGAWNLVLNAQGRIQGDLTVWREDEDLELVIAADQYDRLVAHLDRFIIMDDVELSAAGPEETVIGLTGPQAAEVLSQVGLPALPEAMTAVQAQFQGIEVLIRRGCGLLTQHYELVLPASAASGLWTQLHAAGAVPVGSRALEAFRIAEGIPTYGVDIVERDLPQETSQLRALHFNKGCYLGQEIVERIRSRGSVHRHLRQVELDGPLPAAGTELILDGAVIGNITSAAELPFLAGVRRFAMAMVRAEAEARNLPFTYTSAAAAGSARLLAGSPVF